MTIYTDIEAWNRETESIIRSMGGTLTPPLISELSHAFGEAQKYAMTPSAWVTVDNVFKVVQAVAVKARKGRALSKAEYDRLNAVMVKMSRAMPGKPSLIITGPIVWLGNAASSAGRSIAHTVVDGIKDAGDLVGKIPIVGTPLHAVISIAVGPFNLLGAALQGERLDRALLASVKDEFNAIREVAPYARMVLTSIPGLGVGIGVGLAMAEAAAAGRPIDEVLLAGVVGIVPGGIIGKAVFQFTQHALAGDNLIRTAGNVGLAQLPPAAKAALDTVAAAAKGDNIPKAALANAQKLLPAEAQVALNAGIALGTGQRLQGVILTGIQNAGAAELNNLANKGGDIITSQPLFKAASAVIKGAEQTKGFKVGVAVMGYAGVNETSVYQFRQKLSVDARVGFDLAVSTQIGKVRSKLAPINLPPEAKASFYATKGMAGGAPTQKVAIMKTIAVHPVARVGAAVAVQEMPHTWWQQVLAFLGL